MEPPEPFDAAVLPDCAGNGAGVTVMFLLAKSGSDRSASISLIVDFFSFQLAASTTFLREAEVDDVPLPMSAPPLFPLERLSDDESREIGAAIATAEDFSAEPEVEEEEWLELCCDAVF